MVAKLGVAQQLKKEQCKEAHRRIYTNCYPKALQQANTSPQLALVAS